MMNINENKELKGSVQFDKPVAQGSLTPLDGTFKEEFDKLLTDGIENPLIDFGVSPLARFDLSIESEDADTFLIDTKTIENNDAMFFLNISSSNQNLNLQINDETSIIDAGNYKTMEVSKTLGSLIMKAAENNKSVRLDFDNQVTVVLKVSKEGKIDATFFPQDRQVENYLKNNIDYLKLRFDEQNIAYSNINYKPYKQNNKNKQQGEKQ